MYEVGRATIHRWLGAPDLRPHPTKTRRRKLDKVALAVHVRDFPDALLLEALHVTGPNGAVVIFEPTKDMLRQIWIGDPVHPLAASPALYTAGLAVSEQKLTGRRMDIFIYRMA
ncbi:IS630 transposase-related protein [Acidocella sp.]|uniref:IS630 transposase-related protein n=1 Tax=Acidocella sp. TaxID=50710 RepID=UPI0026245F22|nr:IS630 transposase-related protein [Acidocella sp.]